MRLAELFLPAPREVRIAGAITTVPGLAAVVFALVLLVDALMGTTSVAGYDVYAQAAYFAVLGAGMLACGIGLLLGYTWARSPSFVLALLMLGLGWYMAGPSGRPLWGVPVVLLAVGLMVLLFRAPSRAWAMGEDFDGERDRDGGS